jgi:hypothetical protein
LAAFSAWTSFTEDEMEAIREDAREIGKEGHDAGLIAVNKPSML